MMKAGRERLIVELGATGIAAPILILVLILVRATAVLFLLVMPFIDLGMKIGSWLTSMFPSLGQGAWFQGLGTELGVDVVFVWIEVWILLFVIVKLVRRWKNRGNREA